MRQTAPFGPISSRILLLLVLALTSTATVFAGGPHWVAGELYFDPVAIGQPLRWAGGALTYYTDQGALSPVVTQAQANAMIATAAAVWSSVSTSAAAITSGGSLAEDVSGQNVATGNDGATLPVDIQPGATGTPIGIVYDADGSVIDAIYGAGASDPSSCPNSAVIATVDNFAANGSMVHALMLVNGLCAQTTEELPTLQYEMVRGFGRILGLDWSQANEQMFASGNITQDGLSGWPVMHPIERLCGSMLGACMPNAGQLRTDDIAALNRLYPVTVQNAAACPGKQLTAQNTVSITGTISFRTGQGMQGVNVVAQPLLSGTNIPDPRYTATTVSGAFFQGDTGNRINGLSANARFGSADPALEGWFDLSGIPLPPGQTAADYQITFEPIDPLDSGAQSVGPYLPGQVSPSGTLPTFFLRGLHAGSNVLQNAVIEDSAIQTPSNDGTETSPAPVAPAGQWTGRLTGYGHVAWYQLWIRANREFTVETTALDEHGMATDNKARPLIGIWNGTDATGSAPDAGMLQPFNGKPLGVSTITAVTTSSGELRLGIEDDRGDGRPDYTYTGRVLYADSVLPSHLTSAGGAVVIRGIGFRQDATVAVNGVAAEITGITPTEITAIAPPANGTSGVVLVAVGDPQTGGITAIEDGLSYDANSSDEIGIVAAPSGSLGMGAPVNFTVRVVGPDGKSPAASANVTFSVIEGAASLGCGQPACGVLTGGDGTAAITVTPGTLALTQIRASLSNGASVVAEFTGSAPPAIAALTPAIYVAIGAAVPWSPQVMVLSGGAVDPEQPVRWSAGGAGVNVAASSAASVTSVAGIATTSVTAGPLATNAAQTLYACVGATLDCASLALIAVHPETAALIALSGAQQTLPAAQTTAPVVLRVTDAIGHPMAGAVVTFYETLKQWTPTCPSHGRCPAAVTLGMETVQAISGADGTVKLTPMSSGGQPARLAVLAVTGEVATLSIQIELHP